MRRNLLETYSRQLKVAEAYVAKNFDKQMNSNTALTTAVLLDNTNRWITESMNTVATSRGDLGDWKKFCLNLTNIAVPSLIANDLVIVHPMTSYSGSVAYLKYVARTNKGDVKVGDTFNSVFGLGKMTDSRVSYTSQIIVENIDAQHTALVSTPAECGRFDAASGETVKSDMKVVDATTTEFWYVGVYNNVTKFFDTAAHRDTYKSAGTTTGEKTLATGDKVAYFSAEFQMEQVPAEDIPTIGPVMEHIALVAEPRRIAVRYDQITAFQAKTDYGFSLDKQIAEQACGELAYKTIVA